MKNINKIKGLIKSQCAGYFPELSSIHNYCCSVDGACLFFKDNEEMPCCRYFEEGVLPLDEDLEREYILERKMGVYQGKPVKINVRCNRCNSYFEAGSNRQIYCEKCRKIIKKERARNRQQKLRAERV